MISAAAGWRNRPRARACPHRSSCGGYAAFPCAGDGLDESAQLIEQISFILPGQVGDFGIAPDAVEAMAGKAGGKEIRIFGRRGKSWEGRARRRTATIPSPYLCVQQPISKSPLGRQQSALFQNLQAFRSQKSRVVAMPFPPWGFTGQKNSFNTNATFGPGVASEIQLSPVKGRSAEGALRLSSRKCGPFLCATNVAAKEPRVDGFPPAQRAD